MTRFALPPIGFVLAATGFALGAALALARADSPAAPVHVQPLDPSFDASRFAEPGVVIDPVTGPVTDDESDHEGDTIPSPRAIDRVLADALGAAPLLAKLDRLDRDQLYVRARILSTARLRRLYPALSAARLASLSRRVKARR